MKVAWLNYHYDFCRELSFIMQKLGWEAGMLSSKTFPFFGLKPSIADGELSRLDYEDWICKSFGISLYTSDDDICDLDAIIVRSETHRQAWLTYAKKRGFKPVVIAMYLFPPVADDIKHFYTTSKPTFELARHLPNTLYYPSVWASVATEYQYVGPSAEDHGFYSYINQYPTTWPEAYTIAHVAKTVYSRVGGGGRYPFLLYGQGNPDGILPDGRYGQKNELIDCMRHSIATVHIKDTDAPGRIVTSTMLLGKPLILWKTMIQNTSMEELFSDETCYIVSTSEDIVKTCLALEDDVDFRRKGERAAAVVRSYCSFEAQGDALRHFFERVANDRSCCTIKSSEQRKTHLTSFFQELKASGIEFVVLRNVTDIPDKASLDNDIDILIPQEYFESASCICQRFFPHRTVDTGFTYLYGALPHTHFRNYTYNLHIDVVQKLAYTSPNNGEKIAACAALQKAMRERRQYTECDLPIPGPYDAFIHILGHTIFDKKRMTYRYKKQLEALLPQLDQETLVAELSLLLYSFASEAVSLVAQGKAYDIPKAYYTYTGSSLRGLPKKEGSITGHPLNVGCITLATKRIAPAPALCAERLCIENNIGEAIHIHWRNMRFTIPHDEFLAFAEQVKKSLRVLGPKINTCSRDIVIPDSYRNNLRKLSERIVEVTPDTARLSDLQVHLQQDMGWQVRPITKSPVYCALTEKKGRFNKGLPALIISLIANGYPYKNEYIVVHNDEMLIRDGQHRAAILWWLYGGDITVPIARMRLK